MSFCSKESDVCGENTSVFVVFAVFRVSAGPSEQSVCCAMLFDILFEFLCVHTRKIVVAERRSGAGSPDVIFCPVSPTFFKEWHRVLRFTCFGV